MLRSFLTIWTRRIRALGTFGRDRYNIDMVVEEGATAAAILLTMAIRALDYCPPVDLEFGDFLAALLTVDTETVPDDSKYGYRPVIRRTFQAYGIDDRGHMRIASVRRSNRQGPDGFHLRETICEYVQMASIFGAEARTALGIERPKAWHAEDHRLRRGHTRVRPVRSHQVPRRAPAGRLPAAEEMRWRPGGPPLQGRSSPARSGSATASCCASSTPAAIAMS